MTAATSSRPNREALPGTKAPTQADKIPRSQEADPREQGRDHFLLHQQRLQLFRKSNSQTLEKKSFTKSPAEASESGPTAMLSAMYSHDSGERGAGTFQGKALLSRPQTQKPKALPRLTRPGGCLHSQKSIRADGYKQPNTRHARKSTNEFPLTFCYSLL